ncbi:MAG TPA: hypothetical protein VJL78_05965 [Candidatus Nitrosocosmicus sp.]|jgi:hypothetical protein|nr:hypothetical protein [Candidatus Nitrosocosmicus sp.]
MVFDTPKNNYLRYTDIIHCSFEYYRERLKREIKNEHEKNNNFALIDFFERLEKTLNKTKDYYLNNIGNILGSSENPNKYSNIGILRSVLYVYDKDLDRCNDLLNQQYNLYPVGEGSIKDKSTIVKEILDKIIQRPESSETN